MYMDDNGVWKDVKTPVADLDLSATMFLNAVMVKQWFPSTVPSDCVDNFVYVVFYSDGTASLVYRSTDSDVVVSLLIKARTFGTSTYIAVSITGITEDIDGSSATGTTPASASGGVARRYYQGNMIGYTAPATVGAASFYRWADMAGELISLTRVRSYDIEATETVVAEYVQPPFVRIEDADGNPITSLDHFYAMAGESSEAQSYFAGGIGLDTDLLIYAPENFEISLDETTWVDSESYITIAQADANAGMTEIFVRFIGEES